MILAVAVCCTQRIDLIQGTVVLFVADSYSGSSSSKRYHSPAETPRMGMSTGDYYDSESRSKRSRNDSYGTHVIFVIFRKVEQ